MERGFDAPDPTTPPFLLTAAASSAASPALFRSVCSFSPLPNSQVEATISADTRVASTALQLL